VTCKNNNTVKDNDDDTDDDNYSEFTTSKMKALEEVALKARNDSNEDSNNEELLE
jgi:hypothetical protein